MPRLTLVSLPYVLVAALAAPALADPADDAYQRGRAHYDLREWDEAIAAFKEAYKLRPDAPSLFNIAQSYRLKGDCAEAASFYKTYRRNFPNEKNIARVEQFIREMDECAKQQATTPAPDAATTGTTQPPPPDPTVTTDTSPTTPTSTVTGTSSPPPGAATMHTDQRSRSLALTGLGVAGAGVLGIIGGTVFAFRAQSIEDDVMQLPRWDPDLHDRGERADLLAKVLFGVGGAAVIGGGVLVWLGYRRSESPSASTSLRVVPTTQGASLSWSGTF